MPTWTCIAVHLRGKLVPMPLATMAWQVNALSDQFEGPLAPRPVRKSSKLGAGVMDRMIRMVLPFRFAIIAASGTPSAPGTMPTGLNPLGKIAALVRGGSGLGLNCACDAGQGGRVRDSREGNRILHGVAALCPLDLSAILG